MNRRNAGIQAVAPPLMTHAAPVQRVMRSRFSPSRMKKSSHRNVQYSQMTPKGGIAEACELEIRVNQCGQHDEGAEVAQTGPSRLKVRLSAFWHDDLPNFSIGTSKCGQTGRADHPVGGVGLG